MAISPAFLAGGADYNQTVSSVVTIPAGQFVDVGDVILVTSGVTNDRYVTGVVDSKGNSYTVVAESINGTSISASIIFAHCTTALVAGDTITVTLDRTGGWGAAAASKISGLATADAVDLFATNIGTGSVITVAGSGPTTYADEILISLNLAYGDTTWTPGAGWTQLFEYPPPAGSFMREQQVQYRIISAIETPSSSVTAGSNNWCAALVTFVAGSAEPPPETVSGTLLPDAILAQSGLSGTVAALANDPASSDGSWLTVTP